MNALPDLDADAEGEGLAPVDGESDEDAVARLMAASSEKQPEVKEKLLGADDGFVESEHPRDQDGKFGEGGGAPAAAKTSRAALIQTVVKGREKGASKRKCVAGTHSEPKVATRMDRREVLCRPKVATASDRERQQRASAIRILGRV